MRFLLLARLIRLKCRLRGMPLLLRGVKRRVYSEARVTRVVVSLDRWVPPHPMSWRKDIRIRPGMLEDLVLLRRDHRNGRLSEEFYLDELFVEGRFYLAWVRDEIAGILWVFGPEDRNPLIRLQGHERELGSAYVLPKFRGQGVYISLLDASLGDLKAEGVKSVYGHVLAQNYASLKALVRIGATPVGELKIRWLLGVKSQRFEPLPVPSMPVGKTMRPATRSFYTDSKRS